MRQFICRCGRTVVVSPPSLNAGYVVWDRDVDLSIESRRKEIHAFLLAVASGQREAFLHDFCGSLAARNRLTQNTDADVIEDILSKHDQYTRVCYRCPNCSRIFIQVEPGSGRYQAYEVEEQ